MRPPTSPKVLRRRAQILLLAFFAVVAAGLYFLAHSLTGGIIGIAAICLVGLFLPFGDRWLSEARTRERHPEDTSLDHVCSICGGRHHEEDCPVPTQGTATTAEGGA